MPWPSTALWKLLGAHSSPASAHLLSSTTCVSLLLGPVHGRPLILCPGPSRAHAGIASNRPTWAKPGSTTARPGFLAPASPSWVPTRLACTTTSSRHSYTVGAPIWHARVAGYHTRTQGTNFQQKEATQQMAKDLAQWLPHTTCIVADPTSQRRILELETELSKLKPGRHHSL